MNRLNLRVWIFHDERKKLEGMNNQLAAHSLLVVPESVHEESVNKLLSESEPSAPLSRLYSLIESECSRLKVESELHFTEINGRKWSNFDQASLNILRILSSALRHKGKPQGEFEWPEVPPLYCRWGVLMYPDDRKSLDFYSGDPRERAQAYFETFLRFALKSLLHYGFRGVRVEVLGIVFDGREHLYKDIDTRRVLERLKGELREGISLADEICVEYVDSDHRGSKRPEFSRLLQANDLLLGAATHFFERLFQEDSPGNATMFFEQHKRNYGLKPRFGTKMEDGFSKKALVAWPVVALIQKVLERQREKSLRNSGHYRSFTISKVTRKEDGTLTFQPYQELLEFKHDGLKLRTFSEILFKPIEE
ncbi:MAG: hypothetical protein ACP5LJ_07650 [Candidatus Bipolaricaulaceae bacterium]